MKILLSSHFFHPSIGGIEQVSLILAREFCAAGHEVRVVTTTRRSRDPTRPRPSFSSSIEDEDEDDARSGRLQVIRRPSPLRLWQTVRWSDVVFHNNISLRFAWPLLTIRRPWVVAHHTWLTRTDGSTGWRDRLKRSALRFATNISVSQQIAEHLGVPSIVTGNPYRDEIFRRDPECIRDRDLVFVGRMVSDKGLDFLLEAVSLLQKRAVIVTASVVGEGPLFSVLQRVSKDLRLESQIKFLGAKTGHELAALLNRHRAIVLPSRWQEPFGLAALEGIACGCKAIVPDSGAFRETLGACAILFEHENAVSLADVIEVTLTQKLDADYWKQAERQLSQYEAKRVAARYLEILKTA
jgi:glycogen(starch) synthase